MAFISLFLHFYSYKYYKKTERITISPLSLGNKIKVHVPFLSNVLVIGEKRDCPV